LCEREIVGPEDLPPALRERKNPDRLGAAVAQGLTLEQLEREYIERVMQAEGGNKTRAAQRLGLDRKTLYRKLDEYAASPEPPVRVRLAPDHARIQAMPSLFRVGTPGALAVAQQFGMRGAVRVEEVVIRPGEAVEAEGVLSDPAVALSSGPFRTIDAPLEL